MPYTYHVKDGSLEIVDAVTGATVWHGKPDGYPVWQVLPVPESDDCLVLLEYWARPQHVFENLLRCCSDRSIIWRAELPDPRDDAYVGVQWADSKVSASSWSGYQVLLDLGTGRILSMTFTK